MHHACVQAGRSTVKEAKVADTQLKKKSGRHGQSEGFALIFPHCNIVSTRSREIERWRCRCNEERSNKHICASVQILVL